MRSRIPKLTYANVIATLALFLALGGGAYAATSIPAASVGTSQLRNGAVTGAKVRAGSLIANDFAAGQLPAGATGPEGPKGAAGSAGAKGEPGEPGSDGPKGDTGATGSRGPQGEPGERGARGPQGNAGDEGPQGVQGKQGKEGEAGARGERGAPGPEGPEGDRGERGPRGERGSRGEPGEPGEEGPAGEPGIVRTVTRYGTTVRLTPGPLASYAICRKGELVVGGGFDFLQAPDEQTFEVRADRASTSEPISPEQIRELEEREELGAEGEVFGENEEEEFFVYRAPKDGAGSDGWAVGLSSTGKLLGRASYRAYVQCAVASAG
jgi:hypothetical protein